MIRIAIVDDEKQAIKECQRIIREMKLPTKVQMDAFDNGKHFYEMFFRNGEHYNIIILDIDMPGINGFDIAGEIQRQELNTIIIFHTAYEQYVFKAYEYQPFRYIRKERCAEELPFALLCAIEKIQATSKKHLRLTVGNAVYKIQQANAYYIEAKKHQCFVHTKSHDLITVTTSLSKLTEQLDDRRFVLANSGIPMNLSHIEQIVDENIFLDNQSVIPVSRRKNKSVKEAFIEFLGGSL